MGRPLVLALALAQAQAQAQAQAGPDRAEQIRAAQSRDSDTLPDQRREKEAFLGGGAFAGLEQCSG